ncbi:MAG: signal peptidase II [Elusimicrobia bacterium]|nr:signal peptidase II [Elusimicrobiota bacterium]
MRTGLILIAVFFIDRLSKSLASSYLSGVHSLPVFSFFHLTYVENAGAAFGLFPQANPWLAGVSLALVLLLCLWRRRIESTSDWAQWGMALVLGGALGNLYDRLAYGYVVDFLDFMIWPVFNLADTGISVGVGMLLIGISRRR